MIRCDARGCNNKAESLPTCCDDEDGSTYCYHGHGDGAANVGWEIRFNLCRGCRIDLEALEMELIRKFLVPEVCP